MSDIVYQERVTVGGITKTYTRTKSAGGPLGIDEAIPENSTNLQLTFALDISACKFFSICSTVNALIETNSGSSPTNTLTLIANEPYIWAHGSLHPFLLTSDVTALFVTTGAVGVGQLTVDAIQDVTP